MSPKALYTLKYGHSFPFIHCWKKHEKMETMTKHDPFIWKALEIHHHSQKSERDGWKLLKNPQAPGFWHTTFWRVNNIFRLRVYLFFYFPFERYFKHTEQNPGAYEKICIKSKTPPTHQFCDFFTCLRDSFTIYPCATLIRQHKYSYGSQ